MLIAYFVGWADNGNPTSSPYYSSCFVLGCTSFNPTYGLFYYKINTIWINKIPIIRLFLSELIQHKNQQSDF